MSVSTYEDYIGFKPGTNSNVLLQELENSCDSYSAKGSHGNAEKIIFYLRKWVEQNGIPFKSAREAKIPSLCKAYTFPQYLAKWRKNTNPTFDLLSDNNDEESISYKEMVDFQLKSKEEEKEKSKNITEELRSEVRDMIRTEDFLQELFRQMDKTTTDLVSNKLKNTKIQLDDGAKQQIKDLAKHQANETAVEIAKRIALEEIQRLMPPREIIIKSPTIPEGKKLGTQHNMFETLLKAVGARNHQGHRLNIWLTGPTGSGKTTAAENVAKAFDLAFGSDGSLDADYKVLGFRDANGNIISTQFIEIYSKGGIYVADEIDNWLPSALLSLNAALANGWISTPGGMIKRHEDCCVIACANTWGLGATSEYVGRTKLDAASLDRFQPKINWPYDEKLELAIAQNQGQELGRLWFELISEVRKSVQKQGLKIIISPRATFGGISLLQAGFSAREVVDMTIGAGLSTEQKRSIHIEDNMYYNKIDNPIFKSNKIEQKEQISSDEIFDDILGENNKNDLTEDADYLYEDIFTKVGEANDAGFYKLSYKYLLEYKERLQNIISVFSLENANYVKSNREYLGELKYKLNKVNAEISNREFVSEGSLSNRAKQINEDLNKLAGGKSLTELLSESLERIEAQKESDSF